MDGKGPPGRYSPDPESGLLSLRNRGGEKFILDQQHHPRGIPNRSFHQSIPYHPSVHDPVGENSKSHRFNWKTFMFLRRRSVLFIVAVLALTTGATVVLSLFDQAGIGTIAENGNFDAPPLALNTEAERKGRRRRVMIKNENNNNKEAEASAEGYLEPTPPSNDHPHQEEQQEEAHPRPEDDGLLIDEGRARKEGLPVLEYPAQEDQQHDQQQQLPEKPRGQEEEEYHEAEHSESLPVPPVQKPESSIGEGHQEVEGGEKINSIPQPSAMQKALSKALNAIAEALTPKPNLDDTEPEELPVIFQELVPIPQTAVPAVKPSHYEVVMDWSRSRFQGRSSEEEAALRQERRAAVHAAIMHSWQGYKRYAWGQDELMPISKQGQKWFGLGLTIIDTLDLLWLIGEKEEFEGAKQWVETSLNPKTEAEANVFEVTIRVMGGLLSAYHFSKEQIFLTKAKELGDQLKSAFDTESRIPWSDCQLATGVSYAPVSAPDSSASEATSIQMEFKYLAYLLGDEELYHKAQNSMKAFEEARQRLGWGPDRAGLVPMFINAKTGNFNAASTITLGARADSYYEYLLKQWLLTGKEETLYKDTYTEAIGAIRNKLLGHTHPRGLAFIGELIAGNSFHPKMDHLVCYLPGTLALGYYHGLDESHMDLAKDLMVTCFEMYNSTTIGLAPEIAYFNTHTDPEHPHDITIQPRDTHNILRPETVESLYYLYRITKDPVYREWAWQIFQAFEKHAKIATGGYSGLKTVQSLESERIDKMESFWLGETLKYLYLIFADEDLIPLDDYVLNTEAHPLPVFKPPQEWRIGGEEQPPASVEQGFQQAEQAMERQEGMAETSQL